MRRGEVVQWGGFAVDKWTASDKVTLTLAGNPPTHVLIEDVGGEHLCLTFDGIAFKYYDEPAEVRHD